MTFTTSLLGLGWLGAICIAITLLLSLGEQPKGCPEAINATEYVNVFLGTEGGGNMFPGVVPAPFSMVKLGPDVDDGGQDAYSGYLPDGKVYGFSMLHESGTGGAPKYGVVSQMPVVGDVPNPLLDLGQYRRVKDQAEVGYYKSVLDSGVTVELAGTEHAGLYQYTFPPGNDSTIVVDVSHVLPSFRGLGWGQGYAGGQLTMSKDGRSYYGSGTYNNGWNLAPNWTIHFCCHFDQTPFGARTFVGDDSTLYSYGPELSTKSSHRQGAVFRFAGPNVSASVGVSYISAVRACENVHSEIPPRTALTTLVTRAQSRWTSQLFSRVTTTEKNSTVLKQLYSNLYGMMLMPSNRTGENPRWVSNEPYHDDIFTLWDLFRCGTALTHILQPKAYEEQIRSLIDIWRHEGWLPDARSSDYSGRVQGGSSADNVLADACVKGVKGQVNWLNGYDAMKTDAEIVPPNNFDPSANDSSTKQGRGALSDWKESGYITPGFSRSVTRAVEYAVNDFALYQVASGLNFSTDATKYLQRSRQWRNHWNPLQASLNCTGFLVPRYANGSFEFPYDPTQCGKCYWADPFYEDTPWSYSFNAHHDIDHLIALSGGPEAFVQRLETFFAPNMTRKNRAFGHTLFNPANEPAFTTPYLFNFVGRQDLSVKYSRSIALRYYNAGPAGLPGNSDAGAMQSWILWNMIGLYPLTGQTTFLIGSPWFKHLCIQLGEGRTLTITSKGGDRETAYYVQSLKVNGKKWDRAWVTWEDVFADRGRLDFVLGPKPVGWDTGDSPPSPAS